MSAGGPTPECSTLKFLFESVITPAGKDQENVDVLSIWPMNFPDPLQHKYDTLLEEFNNALGGYERVNIVWMSGRLKYRPSLETVDTFISGLRPGTLERIKSFVVLGECPWLNLVITWLRSHYPTETVSAFEAKFSTISSVNELQSIWPGFEYRQIPMIHPRLFGEPIETVNDGKVPESIVKLMDWVSDYGMSIDGIFRLSADSSALEWLKSLLNAGNSLETSMRTPHEIPCLLKMYFRDLPTPIIDRSLYKVLMELDVEQDPTKSIHVLKTEVLPRLSAPARELLTRLMLLLHQVSANEAVNRMSARNLAICWAPNLIYDDSTPDQFRLLKSSLSTVELMIKEAPAIFN